MIQRSDYDAIQTQVLKLSEAAVAAMQARGVLITPEHYTLFFAYVSGKPEQLVSAVDQIEQAGGTLDPETLERLYHEFFDHPTAATGLFLGQSQAPYGLMGQLLSSLETLQHNNQTVVDDLLSNMQQLHDGSDAHALPEVLEGAVETMMQLKSAGDTMSLELKQAQEEIQLLRHDLARQIEASERDFLTHAYNRKSFEKQARALLEQAVSTSEPFCIALLDIDHFKTINDRYGHAAGDAVLKRVTNLLTDSVKGRDIVARYGGEEFALLLPDTGIEGAKIVLEKVRKLIEEKAATALAKSDGVQAITTSIGVTVVDHTNNTQSLATLVKQADEALYQAKDSGRNQLVCASQ